MTPTTRSLTHDLRALGNVQAPPTLLPAVMARVGLVDRYFPLETPIGGVFVAYNRNGISAVSRAESAAWFERSFMAQFGRPITPSEEVPERMLRAIRLQLEGGRSKDLRYDLRGLSEFERAVLLKALEIPHGEVRPYNWIAREIGRPKAVRAVGSALARNPIPILIPCHRVVRSDGIIGNYGMGGPEKKRQILRAEGADPDELERLARSGARYLGTPNTKVFCFPTCGHAHRIHEANRVFFASPQDAFNQGFRPCKTCRPAAMSA